MNQTEHEKNLLIIVNFCWSLFMDKDPNLFENRIYNLIPKYKFSYDPISQEWFLIK